jgi:hypothetical protein
VNLRAAVLVQRGQKKVIVPRGGKKGRSPILNESVNTGGGLITGGSGSDWDE